MNRREMLKAIAPMLTLGQVFKLERLQDGAQYLVFINRDMIDTSKVTVIPPNVTVIPLRVDEGETMDQAVRMYEVIR